MKAETLPERIVRNPVYGLVDFDTLQRPINREAFDEEIVRRWNAHKELVDALIVAKSLLECIPSMAFRHEPGFKKIEEALNPHLPTLEDIQAIYRKESNANDER